MQAIANRGARDCERRGPRQRGASNLRCGQTSLRTLGIEIVFGREGRLGARTIKISAAHETRSRKTVSTVSNGDSRQAVGQASARMNQAP